MRILLSFLANTELNIHFIQKKEDISSNVNDLVQATATLPTADLSLEVETEHSKNRQNPGIYNLNYCKLFHLF